LIIESIVFSKGKRNRMNTIFFLFFIISTIFTQRLIIEWVKCPDIHYQLSPLDSLLKKNITMFPNDIELQCSYIKVPVNWDDRNNNKTFTYFIRRLKAKNRRGQIWSKIYIFIIKIKKVNDGGPGGSAAWSNYGAMAIKIYKQFDGTLDVIVPSHRGL
jgi:hypothetical protein